MSQSMSTYHIEWHDFKKDWEEFATGKETYNDFWNGDEPNFHDFKDQSNWCSENKIGHSGTAWDYDIVFCSLSWGFQGNPHSTEKYEEFAYMLMKFVCEGGTGVNDLNDSRINNLDIVHGLFSPLSVCEIAGYWDDFDWEWTKPIYEKIMRPENHIPWEGSVKTYKEWVKVFQEARNEGKGIITLLC